VTVANDASDPYPARLPTWAKACAAFTAGRRFRISYAGGDGNDVVLTAYGPGDADADGDVDLSDLGALATHFGQTSGAGSADGGFDGDGDVDLNDLGALASNFEPAARQPQANVQFASYRPRVSTIVRES
jgi:hypothetical protein